MPVVQAHLPRNLVVFAGQSRNISPGSGNAYPFPLMAQVPSASAAFIPPLSCTAFQGRGWNELTTYYSTFVYRHAHAGTNRVILVMEGGESDIGDGAGLLPGTADGPTAYGYQKTYAQAATAAGFNYIINTTLCKASAMTGGQETNRQNLNTLILANADNAWNAAVDIASDSHLTDPTNATYYTDGLHWTAAGAVIVANLILPSLTAALV